MLNRIAMVGLPFPANHPSQHSRSGQVRGQQDSRRKPVLSEVEVEPFRSMPCGDHRQGAQRASRDTHGTAVLVAQEIVDGPTQMYAARAHDRHLPQLVVAAAL